MPQCRLRLTLRGPIATLRLSGKAETLACKAGGREPGMGRRRILKALLLAVVVGWGGASAAWATIWVCQVCKDANDCIYAEDCDQYSDSGQYQGSLWIGYECG